MVLVGSATTNDETEKSTETGFGGKSSLRPKSRSQSRQLSVGHFEEGGCPSVCRRFVNSYTRHCESPSTLADCALSFIPFVEWLPKIRAEQLPRELLAGVMLAVFNLPLGVACANLAGVPLSNGLYTMIFGALIYPIFAAWPHGNMGPHAGVDIAIGVQTHSVLETMRWNNETAAEFPIDANAVNSTLTFMNGIFCILFAILRLDFLTDYFSDSLVGGFNTGIALYVVVAQANPMLGLPRPPKIRIGFEFPNILQTFDRLPHANPVAVLMSAGGLVFVVGAKMLVDPLVKKWTPLKRIPMPWEFIMVLVASSICAVLSLDTTHNLPIVGPLARHIPLPSPPLPELFSALLLTSAEIAAVQAAAHAFALRLLRQRRGYVVERRQEIYAAGATLLLSGWFPVYAPQCGVGQSVMLEAMGAESPIAVFVSGVIILLLTCVMAVLVLVVVGKQLSGVFILPELWLKSKWDFCIWMVTFIASITTGVISGLAVGVVFQLFTVVVRTQWPRWNVDFMRGGAGAKICVFEFESMLLFTNAEKFVTAVQRTVADWDAGSRQRILVFDCDALTEFDGAGRAAFARTLNRLRNEHPKSLRICFVKLRARLVADLRAEGVEIEDDSLFDSVDALKKR